MARESDPMTLPDPHYARRFARSREELAAYDALHPNGYPLGPFWGRRWWRNLVTSYQRVEPTFRRGQGEPFSEPRRGESFAEHVRRMTFTKDELKHITTTLAKIDAGVARRKLR